MLLHIHTRPSAKIINLESSSSTALRVTVIRELQQQITEKIGTGTNEM